MFFSYAFVVAGRVPSDTSCSLDGTLLTLTGDRASRADFVTTGPELFKLIPLMECGVGDRVKSLKLFILPDPCDDSEIDPAPESEPSAAGACSV
jgi:hypothetical protein